MRPDTANKLVLGSFRTPVPVPTLDPGASPTKTFAINCQWLPYIRGALMQLVLQYTWPEEDPSAVLLAQQRAMTLIGMFDECDALPPAFACPYDFTASDGGWEAFPQSIYGYSPGDGAVYDSGLGWSFNDCTNGTLTVRIAYIWLAVDPTATISAVNFTYNLIKGASLIGDNGTGVQFYDASNTVIQDDTALYTTFPDGSDLLFSWSGAVTGASHVKLLVSVDANESGPCFGDCLIKSANVYGAGPTPC